MINEDDVGEINVYYDKYEVTIDTLITSNREDFLKNYETFNEYYFVKLLNNHIEANLDDLSVCLYPLIFVHALNVCL